MEDGKAIPFQTTYQGLYDRCEEHRNQPPFDLPGRWKTSQERIKLSVPYNFVSTADIIGGNSGSPVVNKAGEFVGIIFDGNIHSLVAGIAYDEEQSRAVAVHSAGIIEALQSVYNAGDLVKEIRSGQLP
ncbi:Dipeptidyl aminopeptidase BII [bioreactor metagenome]|uniref:Dipeptidyl aminopeptidase BII n=1 Tax=bioreactor metagenome TaxID=1076179 RepID=A0A645F054_9ZZZZ